VIIQKLQGRVRFLKTLLHASKREEWKAESKATRGKVKALLLQNKWADIHRKFSPRMKGSSLKDSLIMANKDAQAAPTRKVVCTLSEVKGALRTISLTLEPGWDMESRGGF